MSNDKIAEALGIRTLEEVKDIELPEVVEPEVTTDVAVVHEEDESVADIELARSNIKNIIQQGDDALKEMMELAKQSESPRAFEVASGLMKTLLDANKDFVDVSTKKKFAKEELNGPKETAATNVTNNLIMTTSEVMEKIRGEILDDT